MKKLLISFCIFFNLQSSAQSSFGAWQSIKCYQGLDFCVKRNEYNDYAKKYNWTVKFRNRYNTPISFNYVLKESNVQNAKTTSRSTIQPSGEDGTWFLVDDANQVNVVVDGFRFGEDAGPYAACGSSHNDVQTSLHNQGPSAGSHTGGNSISNTNVAQSQNSNQGMTMHNIDNLDQLNTELEELAQKVGQEAANGNTAGIKSTYQKMIQILKQMIRGYENDPESKDALIGVKNQLEQIEEILKTIN